MLNRKKRLDLINQLDPKKNYWEIMHYLVCYEIPWDIERALEFALFRTYAIPSISQLLCKTQEFTKNPRKRYDDTELILYEVIEHGFKSDRGQCAIARMNAMHHRFAIANNDYLYVLSTFIYEPIRWIEQFGWRKLSINEKQAFFYYYCELGRQMQVTDLPEDYYKFEKFNQSYEQHHFQYQESNTIIASTTRDLFLGFYLPKIFWGFGRPIIYAMLDTPLAKAFNYPEQPQWLKFLVKFTLKLRGKWLNILPAKQKPFLGTQIKRPSYPNGYAIEALGTFTKKHSNPKC